MAATGHLPPLARPGPLSSTTNPATFIASFSARLNGLVDPHGLTTSVHFQYGTTSSYGLTTAPQSQTETRSKLQCQHQRLNCEHTLPFPNRSYERRRHHNGQRPDLYHAYADRSACRHDQCGDQCNSFFSDTEWLTRSAWVAHDCSFPIWHDDQLRATTPMQNQTGNTYRNIAANISGLTRHTTYHFRIVATNSAGTTNGQRQDLYYALASVMIARTA